MLVGFILEHPLASKHLVARRFLAVHYIPRLELLPVLAELLVHALSEFLLKDVTS